MIRYIDAPNPPLPVCDLCSDPNPVHRYPCEDHIAVPFTPVAPGEEIAGASRGDWLACQSCAELIDSGDLKGLANRSLANLLAKHPKHSPAQQAEILAQIESIHRQFFERRSLP